MPTYTATFCYSIRAYAKVDVEAVNVHHAKAKALKTDWDNEPVYDTNWEEPTDCCIMIDAPDLDCEELVEIPAERPYSWDATQLASQIAALSLDGEIVDGELFLQAHDDAFDTLRSLIGWARKIMGHPEVRPDPCLPATELTPEGEQYVVPGCERHPSLTEPQGDLW